ncbi:metalloregulator ArsR/SmtB family transcription factor [Brachybacterium sp.]|uniref:ArsR/SmtB family transcription factor n=1 Tax=Brachybacterium sp. TaxID=1891286 RepID=UPI002ED2E84B
MDMETGVREAAQLFKQLGNESRLLIMRLLADRPRSVQALTEATALSQPLVSQHLRTLRQSDLVTGQRRGREVVYQLTDHHVSHVIEDALAHVNHDHHTDVDNPPSSTPAAEETS